MKNLIFFILIILLFSFSACGRKGNLENIGENKRPNFDKISDEKI
jgi:predicted small lipoprotein YifL